MWDENEKRCGEGDDAKDGQIVLARWNSAQDAADGERPSELITEDFGDIRFRDDREYFTLAFLPEDDFEDIPVRPDILTALNNLSDVPPEENIDAPEATDDHGPRRRVEHDDDGRRPARRRTTVAESGDSTTTTGG